jgi:hypothetical protein
MAIDLEPTVESSSGHNIYIRTKVEDYPFYIKNTLKLYAKCVGKRVSKSLRIFTEAYN